MSYQTHPGPEPTREELYAMLDKAAEMIDDLQKGALMVKCVGIIGKLFGHKFHRFGGWHGVYCYRCGMPKGGWES